MLTFCGWAQIFSRDFPQHYWADCIPDCVTLNWLYYFQLGGVGSCKGDSGGPLMHFVSEAEVPHYVQVGVVHGGIGECGSKNFPGIYARLEDEDNLNFIRQAIGLRE